MKPLQFEPEDFHGIQIWSKATQHDCSAASRIAQKIYDEYVQSLPVVYGHCTTEGDSFSRHYVVDASVGATHQARLLNVEPIEKKECEHGPFWVGSLGFRFNGESSEIVASCHKCGVKLKAKWEVAE